MPMDRRRFLKTAAETAAGIAGLSFYCNDKDMRELAAPEGKILADLHTHPSKNYREEELLETLSRGIVGLTERSRPSATINYDDAILLPGAKEIEKGLLARIEHKGKTGYVARTQEILSDHHILAIGCRLPVEEFPEARDTIEEIHRKGGIAIIAHPGVKTTGRGIISYRRTGDDEKPEMAELCEMADEIESFNASCINLTFGIIIPDMNPANDFAKSLAAEYNLKGIASSDTHFDLEQVLVAGIYLPDGNVSTDSIKHSITSGNFERLERYVSRWSFIQGRLLER